MLSPALGTGTQQGSQLTLDVFSISVLLTPVGPREVIYPWAILLYARMESSGMERPCQDQMQSLHQEINNNNKNTFLGTSDALGVDKATSHVLPPSLYHQPHLLALRAQFGASTVLGEPVIWVFVHNTQPSFLLPWCSQPFLGSCAEFGCSSQCGGSMHLVVQASNPATEHQHPWGASGWIVGAHSTQGAEGKAEAPPKPSPSYCWKWGGTGLT